MEPEQAQVPADLAVVALLRFLDPLQVRLQVRLAQERGAVDALHRLVLRIPLPVGVRRAQELERLEPTGRGHVGADAEIDERVAVLDGVAGDLGLPGGLLFDELNLQRLAVGREELRGLLARPHLPLVRQILRGQLLHLLLDRLEVLRHERPVDDEVVEEPLVGRRTDPALRAWKEVRDGGGHEVCRAVPVQRERLGAVGRHQPDGRIVRQRPGQIHQAIVHDRGECGFREARRDLCRDVARSAPGGQATARTVG